MVNLIAAHSALKFLGGRFSVINSSITYAAASDASNGIRQTEERAVSALGVALVGFLAWVFHDLTWVPADDGSFAYVAEEVLNGRVLHRDVQDIHAGYIHYLNAAAFRIFGVDMVSLRYPLIALTTAQAALAAWLLRGSGPINVFAGVLAAGAFSFILFPNPTQNWYCVFIGFALMALGMNERIPSARRNLAFGFLVGLAFLLRQATGVFFAGAVLILALRWRASENRSEHGVFASLLLGIGALGFLLYAVSISQPAGLVLFGLGPVALLAASAISIRLNALATATIVGQLIIGAIVSAAPLVANHLYYGTFGLFWADAIIAPLKHVAMPFFAEMSFGFLLLPSTLEISRGNLLALGPFLFWSAVLLMPAALSVAAVRRIWSGKLSNRMAGFLVIPVFGALVAAYYEIPVYLIFTTALALVGLLGVSGERRQSTGAAFALVLSASAITFIAGGGVTTNLVATAMLAPPAPQVTAFGKASIRVDVASRDEAAAALDVIAACTTPDDGIFAAPLSAHLYFLSDRPNAFRFWSTSFALHSDKDVAAAAATLNSTQGPKLIVHRRTDKYNTPQLAMLLGQAGRTYNLSGADAHFDYYTRIGEPVSDACEAALKGKASPPPHA